MALPDFLSRGAKAEGANNATDLSPGVPPGLAEGNIILFAAISGAGGEWNSIEDNNGVAATEIPGSNDDADFTASFWWYRCPATVPTSFLANRNPGGQPLVIGFAWSGCIETGTPFEGATVLIQATTAGNDPDSSDCTTTGADRLLVVLAGVDDDPDWSSFPEGTFTDAGGDSSTTGSDARIDGCYKAVPAATTVPGVQIGTLPGNDFWATLTLALIPAAAGALEVNPTPAVAATAVPPPTVDRVLALTPSPVAMPAVVPAPTAELSLSVAPAPVEATVAVPPPTVTFGALAFTADPAEVAAVVPAPALERTLDVAPDPITMTFAPVAPAIAHTLATTAAPAEATLVVPAPAVTLVLEAAPDPVEAELVVPAPTVSRTLSATAEPIEAQLVVPAPTVTLSLAATADPVKAELVVPAPTVTVQGGALAVLPVPAAATFVVPAPTVSMGAITLHPDPVELAIAAGQPVVELAMRTEAGPVVTVLAVPAPAVTFGVGQITIEPQAIVLTLVAPAPRVTSARVRITKEALVDRAWAAAQTRRPARISRRTAGV